MLRTMADLPIEDIHRLLDALKRGMQDLDEIESASVDVAELPEICSVVIEVMDWQQTAYNGNPLVLEPSVLSKFLTLRGRVPRQTARVVAERLRSYLRSQDQASPEYDDLDDEVENVIGEEAAVDPPDRCRLAVGRLPSP